MRSVCRALLLMSLVSSHVWAQNQSANAARSAEEEIKSLEHERNVAIQLWRGTPTLQGPDLLKSLKQRGIGIDLVATAAAAGIRSAAT